MQPIILVPYRDRAEHLKQFIPAITDVVKDARIFIVEQADKGPFNRGALFNAGFKETESLNGYFILHDIDLIPRKGAVDYSYCEYPTHLSAHCSQFNYKLPYENIFGGVVVVNAGHFKAVNGFPNALRGWGGEDDLFYQSFIARGIQVKRKNCWFESLPHPRRINREDYQHNLNLFRRGRNFDDGVLSCSYTVLEKEKNNEYEHIKIRF